MSRFRMLEMFNKMLRIVSGFRVCPSDVLSMSVRRNQQVFRTRQDKNIGHRVLFKINSLVIVRTCQDINIGHRVNTDIKRVTPFRGYPICPIPSILMRDRCDIIPEERKKRMI